MILGYLCIEEFLTRTKGEIIGSLVTDAKERYYKQEYSWQDDGDEYIIVQRVDGRGDAVKIAKMIPLTEELIAFFGLYSGDGAKGTEDTNDSSRIVPTISFSQKEPNLVRFAVDQFRKLCSGNIKFTFSLGEDSAYFMDHPGMEMLYKYYKTQGFDEIPSVAPLETCQHQLTAKDKEYLVEVRPDVAGRNEDHLAFYYTHKNAMEVILTKLKRDDLNKVGISILEGDRVTASLRRPFKKGSRQPGGSSRSDEIHVGGLNGFGELFLKMLHEIEDSILRDTEKSAAGLVKWNGQPSQIGGWIETQEFFTSNPYGQIAGERPKWLACDTSKLTGQWPRSSETTLMKQFRIDPLWCYTSGLYLAEGTTDKAKLFRMFSEKPGSMGLSFTSSEGTSIELMLRTLNKLFPITDCVDAWKVKVGSQYFPELVVTGLKQGVAMLRGGDSGDGKLRTMEISLAIRGWALAVADAPLSKQSLLRQHYADKFSHVEPTGAGVARIDFWGSSKLCRWYFPLLMYTVFGEINNYPARGFYQC